MGKFLAVIVSFFGGLFSNYSFLVSDVVFPILTAVGEIQKSLKAGKLQKHKFSVFASKSKEVYQQTLKLFVDSIVSLGVITVNPDDKQETIILNFYLYLESLSKPLKDAVLFKLASTMIQQWAKTHQIELSGSEADTLTQIGFAKLKLDWSN